MNINVIVEVPQGSRNKYEMNHDTVWILLAGYCSPPPATRPTTGSSPGTLPGDGDPPRSGRGQGTTVGTTHASRP